jgi:hypothetical protein
MEASLLVSCVHDSPGMGRSAPATDDVRMTRFTVSFAFTTEPSTFCTATSAQFEQLGTSHSPDALV